MNRSLVLKASALARGTRRIPVFSEPRGDEQALELATGSDDATDHAIGDVIDNAIDAEFVELGAAIEPVAVVALAALEPVEPVRVTPGRARRATDAYASSPVPPRPIIAIG